jgi:hypothetical protein
VVRVPHYRSRGSGFDSWQQIFGKVVAMEHCPLSLERITEKLLAINGICSDLETLD